MTVGFQKGLLQKRCMRDSRRNLISARTGRTFWQTVMTRFHGRTERIHHRTFDMGTGNNEDSGGSVWNCTGHR
jgi:hypothetical protein